MNPEQLLKLQHQPSGNQRRSEQGVAILLALVVTILLALLAITLTSSSLDEFRRSIDFESREKALTIADSGLWLTKHNLTGQNVDVLLATPTLTPKYLPYADPAPGSHEDRNPLNLVEARNIDFDRPPPVVGTRSVTGLITPVGGAMVGTGRFFAKLSDNLDEAKEGLPNDPLVDIDRSYVIRVIGVQRAAHDEQVTYGSSRKNATSVIEGVIKKDSLFLLPAPITIAGPDCIPNVDGNAFDFDGYDHAGMSSVSIRGNHPEAGLDALWGAGTLYDDETGVDGGPCARTINDSLMHHQDDNISGAGGDFGDSPSLADVTQEVREGDNRDALGAMDAEFIQDFYTRTLDTADQQLTDGASMTGAGVTLGTPLAPQVTVGVGDLELGGGGAGAGLLLVRGALTINGAFEFEGLIVVLGGELNLSGANKGVIGGIYLADLEADENGDPVFGDPSFTVGGNSNFYYASDRIKMALDLLPLKLVSWREVTPEIEPPPTS